MGRVVAVAALALGVAGAARAQSPAGPEFRVNSYTTGRQYNANVKVAPGGAFTVVWVSDDQDGSLRGVFGQAFDAEGRPAGSEFRVNTYTTGFQGSLKVGLGLDRSGNRVVSWGSLDQNGTFYKVLAQRYDRAGRAQGSEFLVGGDTVSPKVHQGAAMAPNGTFVVVWAAYHGTDAGDVFARRFDAAGAAQGAEFRVNTSTLFNGAAADVAMSAAGDFVVAFVRPGSGAYDVKARRFDAAGVPLGLPFAVNTYPFGATGPMRLDIAADGSFVVVWGGFEAEWGVFGRRFDPQGVPISGEFRASTSTASVGNASVAFDGAGRFVVAWPERYHVYARRFDASGAAVGAPFDVGNGRWTGQNPPVVASDAVGNFVVVWTDPNQDGSYNGIYAQRFGGLQPAGLSVADAGDGILQAGEAFTLATSWRNVSDAPQAFTGTSTLAAAPAGLALTLSPTAAYGTVPSGAVRACQGPCFGGTLTGTRPAGHVDATFTETILPAVQGQVQKWRLHVGDTFGDVPRASPFYGAIETLAHHGVTGGCGGPNYCAGTAVTREQMAAFLLAAREGAGWGLAACTSSSFTDVPPASPFCRWIEEMARRGITGGCGGGNYCPTQPVTREQMSVFLLRTLDPSLSPPACTTPVFDDVPASSPFCRWIEELVRRDVTAGCGGGHFCPADAVTREQMAVFLAKTFGLTLYGP